MKAAMIADAIVRLAARGDERAVKRIAELIGAAPGDRPDEPPQPMDPPASDKRSAGQVPGHVIGVGDVIYPLAALTTVRRPWQDSDPDDGHGDAPDDENDLLPGNGPFEPLARELRDMLPSARRTIPTAQAHLWLARRLHEQGIRCGEDEESVRGYLDGVGIPTRFVLDEILDILDATLAERERLQIVWSALQPDDVPAEDEGLRLQPWPVITTAPIQASALSMPTDRKAAKRRHFTACVACLAIAVAAGTYALGMLIPDRADSQARPQVEPAPQVPATQPRVAVQATPSAMPSIPPPTTAPLQHAQAPQQTNAPTRSLSIAPRPAPTVMFWGAVYSNQTGQCLDSNPNGDVYAEACNGGNYQNWYRIASGAIRNAETGRCLDSNHERRIYTLDCNGGNFQNWAVVRTSGNVHTLRNVETGLCLDSADVRVYGEPCNGGNFQNWVVTR